MTTTNAVLDDLTGDETKEAMDAAMADGRLSATQLDDLAIEGLIREMQSADVEIARLEARKVQCAALLDQHWKEPPSLIEKLAESLHITEKEAEVLVASSRALANRLPRTLGLMRRGELNFFLAKKVVKATTRLSDDQARCADEALEPRLPDKNYKQVQRAAYYAAETADPDAMRRREQRRQASRGMRLTPRGSSARLTLENLPVKKATKAHDRIMAAARELHTQEEPRTLDQLCADIAMDLLLRGDCVGAKAPTDAAQKFRRPPRPQQRPRRARRARRRSGRAGSAGARRG